MRQATTAGERIPRSPRSAGTVDELVDPPGDDLLNRFGERRRQAVGNHGPATLPPVLHLETQRAIHYHISTEDDPDDAAADDYPRTPAGQQPSGSREFPPPAKPIAIFA
jgi:hypothetical protein